MYTKCYINNFKSFNTGSIMLSKLSVNKKDKPKLVKTDTGYRVIRAKGKLPLVKRVTNNRREK